MKSQGDYQIKDVHKDRRPLDTHPFIHQVADQFFEQQFGIPLRSNSLFVTKEPSSASRFGDEHLVFPTKSSWRFFGSQHVSDFTAYLNKNLHDHYSEQIYTSKLGKSKWVNNQPPELTNDEQQLLERGTKQLLEQADYKELSVEELHNFPRHYEIMLVADSYIAVNSAQAPMTFVREYLEEMLPENS